MLIFFAKFSKFSKTLYKNSQILKNTTKNVIYAHAKNKIFKIFKNVIYAHRYIWSSDTVGGRSDLVGPVTSRDKKNKFTQSLR